MMNSKTKAYTTITMLVTVIVFVMCSLTLCVPNGYSIGPSLLLILSGILVMKEYRVSDSIIKKINHEDLMLLGSFVVYFLVLLGEVLWFELRFKELDKPIRFLFTIPILILLIKYPPKISWLWRGIIVGAISAGLIAIYQKLWLMHDRANGFIYPIQFGDLSMLLGVICLTGIAWGSEQRKHRLWILFFSLGAILGICASLLSGSRGGWIGFPIISIMLIRNYISFLSLKHWVGIVTSFCVLFLSILAVPETGVLTRIYHIYYDLYQYYHGNSFTSLGARFDLWRMANYMFGHRPIFGYGSYAFNDMREIIVAKFGYGQTVLEQNLQSAHNEILDAAAKRGGIGVLALAGIYFVPLALFYKFRHSHDMTIRSLALAGSMLPVCFIDFGMSQVLFTHNDAVMFYPFVICVLWASLRERRNQIFLKTLRKPI